jgi:hypothetical protein
MTRVLILVCGFLFCATSAHAGQSDAREVARINNCSPKKIEVVQNLLGGSGKTVYKVACNLPKTTGEEKAGGPDAVLIECDQSLCTLMRPVAAEAK